MFKINKNTSMNTGEEEGWKGGIFSRDLALTESSRVTAPKKNKKWARWFSDLENPEMSPNTKLL